MNFEDNFTWAEINITGEIDCEVYEGLCDNT